METELKNSGIREALPATRQGYVYTIFDRKAQDFGPIFEAPNDSVAARYYKNLMKENPYPEDFLLLVVATYAVMRGRYYLDPLPSMEEVNWKDASSEDPASYV